MDSLFVMNSILISIIDAFTSQGLIGLTLFLVYTCILAIVAMGYFYYKSKLASIADYAAEHQQDKHHLMTLVENNTAAMTKNTFAIEHCGLVVNQNNKLLQTCLEHFYAKRKAY